MLKWNWLFLLVSCLALHTSAQTKHVPDLLFLNKQRLLSGYRKFQNQPKNPSPLITQLLSDARRALKAEPVSVMQKKDIPPSGNKHDYMSLGPYWWPDSTKPNGQKKWRWTQIVPLHPERLHHSLRMAAEKFGGSSYATTAQAFMNDVVQSSREMFFLPPQL